MKGVWPHEEIARLPQDVSVASVHRLEVPGVEGERHLVILGSAGAQRQGEN
jgi:16S rRNA (guanine527-N7)-methyltransferase